MPSTTRRALLASTGVALAAAAGCVSGGPFSAEADEDPDPHWVTVYLMDREETRDVSVTIRNGDGNAVFEEEYRLSDSNEADEDATFPASSEPETVVVTVDGTRFERDWPGFEQPELPCDGPNEAGIELRVESDPDGNPEIRMLADCQSATEG
jgi:hypothetical protein